MIYVIIIWIALGMHSVYYYVRQYTKHYDLKASEWPFMVLCFLVPIVTHISTYFAYMEDEDDIVLFKKRKK